MRQLPPPGTFAEGQRYIYGFLASAAGMFCGVAAGFMVALLMGRLEPRRGHHALSGRLTVRAVSPVAHGTITASGHRTGVAAGGFVDDALRTRAPRVQPA